MVYLKKISAAALSLLCMMTASGFQEDFEGADVMKSYSVKGKSQLTTVSGNWQTVTVNFNSSTNNQVLIYLATKPSCTGRIQFDNVRFSPAVEVPNADFETNGGWTNVGGHAKFDDKNASSGKRSVYGEFPLDTSPRIDVRQLVNVKPHTEYEMKVDVLVTDSFEGEAQVLVFNYNGNNCIIKDWNNSQLSRFVQVRNNNGRRVLELNPEKNQKTVITRKLPARKAVECRRFKIEVLAADLKGQVNVDIKDSANGKVVKNVVIKGGKKDWHKIAEDIMLPKSAELQITADGSGKAWVDNIKIGDPEILPTPQNVVWSQNIMPVSKALTIAVKGDGGVPMTGAMELLAKDLKKHNIRLVKSSVSRAKVKIFIGKEYGIKGHEKEGYTLKSDLKGVEIKAATPAGAFYGVMSLLQLITDIGGRTHILGCNIKDYPDMEIRGILGGSPEKAARWKMNTLMLSTGFMDPNSVRYKGILENNSKLNLEIIPYFLTLATHNMMVNRVPGVIAGREIKDVKVTLKGTAPSPLAHKFIVRSKLAKIKVTSSSGRAYEEGKDFTVVDGKFNSAFDPKKTSTFTTLARTANSAIADGETVLVSYNYVDRTRGTFYSHHIPYIPFEPQARKLMDGYLETLSKHLPVRFVNTAMCIYEFAPTANQLATDSRIKAAKMTAGQIYVSEVLAQTKALKKHDPSKRLWIWTGTNTALAKEVAPKLDRSTVVNIWGYDAGWVDTYGQDAMDMWSKLGYTTVVMPWTSLRNVYTYAQLIKYGKDKSYPAIGMIGSTWGRRFAGFPETAETSWRIPRPGEKRYVKMNWK